MVHQVPDVGGSEPDPGKARNAKIGRGCGGCSCVLAILYLIGGVVLTLFGMERATKEALPFGITLLAITLPTAIVGAGLLYWGMTALKKLNQ